ncbi:MAG: hypothetical protein ACK2T4_07250 [Candidatus Promineifilaceae bacterium]|jgi:hypothetical protein
MVEQALQLLEQADVAAAVKLLEKQADPLTAAAAYNDLAKELYWQQRDIAKVVAVCQAGIRFCFQQAEESGARNREKAIALLSAAKQLAYNLASFTWPGWPESRIEITPLQIADGMDGARLNLRLALKLDKDDLALSRAYWMLAGHLLAANATAGAGANYQRAAMYAERAGEEAEYLLSLAFTALISWMAEPQSNGRRFAYEVARESVAEMENGQDYLEQLDSARKAFFS